MAMQAAIAQWIWGMHNRDGDPTSLWGNRKIYTRYLIVRSVGHGSLMQRECEQTEAKMHDQRQAALSSNIITAFTS